MSGHSEIVSKLCQVLILRKAGSVSAKNAAGDTALHLAVRAGKLHAVGALLDHGANMEVANKAGVTPMEEANEEVRVDGVGDGGERGVGVCWAGEMIRVKKGPSDGSDRFRLIANQLTCLVGWLH